MKLKRIQIFTRNFYKFIILLYCMEKAWATSKIPDQHDQLSQRWYHRYLKTTPATLAATTMATTSVPNYQSKNVHEAIHAFKHAQQHVHLRHMSHGKYHHHQYPAETTSLPPQSQNLSWISLSQHRKPHDSYKPSRLTHHHNTVNQSKLKNTSSYPNTQHHLNQQPYNTRSYRMGTTTTTATTPIFRAHLLPFPVPTPSAPSTPSPLPQTQRISLLRDEHFRKITRAENAFPFDKIRTTASPSTAMELNGIRSAYNSRNRNDDGNGGDTGDGYGGDGFGGGNKNDDEDRALKTSWQHYLNDFNEKNGKHDMLTTNSNVQQYFKRFVVNNKGDDDDDDDDTSIGRSENSENRGGILNSAGNYKDSNSWKRIDILNSAKNNKQNNNNVGDDNDDDDIDDEDDDDEDDEDYDDLYLDDESVLDETGSLTEEKWRNFGTAEAVEKSRRQTLKSIHQMAAHNATAHISRIYSEALCKTPRPKIIPIVAEPSKTYVPHCTVLHRCGDDTGCCHTDALTCVPKRTVTVDLYFYVSTLGKREPSVELLSFINHTECHCVNRHERPDRHRYSSSSSASSLSGRTQNIDDNIGDSILSSSNENNTSSNRTEPHCRCVKYFMEFIERVDDDMDDDSDEGNRDSSPQIQRRRCRCDCQAGNATCESYKKGKEGFSIEDRRCILDKRCTLPACEYGQYIKRSGRCPKLQDKLASARNLFFD